MATGAPEAQQLTEVIAPPPGRTAEMQLCFSSHFTPRHCTVPRLQMGEAGTDFSQRITSLDRYALNDTFFLIPSTAVNSEIRTSNMPVKLKHD